MQPSIIILYVCAAFYQVYADIKIFRRSKRKKAEETAFIEQEKERAIRSAMAVAGWTREEALSRIEDCHIRLGISYTDYRKVMMYRVEEQDQQHIYEDYIKRKAEAKAERQACRREIAERNGWTMTQALEEIDKITSRTGCDMLEVWSYKLEDMTEEQQAALLS